MCGNPPLSDILILINYGHLLVVVLISGGFHHESHTLVDTSAANRLISEVVQSRRRPLLGPSPG